MKIQYYQYIFKSLLLLVLFYSPYKATAKEVTIASDIWCPYICQSTEKPGYIVEMINDILQANKIKTINVTIPLARAIKILQNGDVDIVLGLTQQHIDQHGLIRSTIAVGSFANDFFVSPNNPWRFTTLEQLEKLGDEGVSIGIIKGYQYGEKINELIVNKPAIFSYSYGDSPLAQNIKRLRSGRINILLDSKNTVLNSIMSLNSGDITYAGTQGLQNSLYLAFSTPAGSSLLRLIDQGIIEYRRSGKLEKLLTQYGIVDWH